MCAARAWAGRHRLGQAALDSGRPEDSPTFENSSELSDSDSDVRVGPPDSTGLPACEVAAAPDRAGATSPADHEVRPKLSGGGIRSTVGRTGKPAATAAGGPRAGPYGTPENFKASGPAGLQSTSALAVQFAIIGSYRIGRRGKSSERWRPGPRLLASVPEIFRSSA